MDVMIMLRRSVATLLLATVPLTVDALSASARTPAPKVIRTVSGATIGGLPVITNDRKIEVLPQSPKIPAATTSGHVAQRTGGPWQTGATGYDISWPQCPAHNAVMPPPSTVAIVGVNDGTPFTTLPCMQEELDWAKQGTPAQYFEVNSPIGYTTPTVLQYAFHGPAGDCTATDYRCQAFNWGFNDATNAVQQATAAGFPDNVYLLDTEIPDPSLINPPGAHCYDPNWWTCDPAVNSAVLIGARTSLAALGKTAATYGTKQQWQQITGGLPLGIPTWIAGWDHPAATYCDPANASTYWFGGARPWLVQGNPQTYDPDTAC
jgi:hypothetical protein